MRKWAVSQCNRQTTIMRHLETQARQHSYVMPSEVMTLYRNRRAGGLETRGRRFELIRDALPMPVLLLAFRQALWQSRHNAYPV